MRIISFIDLSACKHAQAGQPDVIKKNPSKERSLMTLLISSYKSFPILSSRRLIPEKEIPII